MDPAGSFRSCAVPNSCANLHPSPQEVDALRRQQAALQAALGRAEQEAAQLAAQLETSQRDASAANAMLATAQSRSESLDKAWRAAAEVRRTCGHVCCDAEWCGSTETQRDVLARDEFTTSE